MKKIFLLLIITLFINNNAKAVTTYQSNDTPFVFIENNIEYAVFKNGEFNFNETRNYTSYNTPYILKNRYGDIVQIENTSINYDYNGRVNRIGNVYINYNRYGYVSNIGNLNIQYNNYGNNYTCTGYVNNYNHHYKARYSNYRRPTIHHHLYKNTTAITSTYYGNGNHRQHTSVTIYKSPKNKYKKYSNSGRSRLKSNNSNKEITKKRIRETNSYSYNNKNGNYYSRRRR